MLFLANAVMKSPVQALLWSALLGAATVFFSLFGLLSGAVIALVTLAVGLNAGIRALLATLAGAFAFALMIEQTTQFTLAVFEFWLPALVLAVVLGMSGSLSKTIQVATVGMLALLALVYLIMPSPEVFWKEAMQGVVASWQRQGVELEVKAVALLVDELPAVLTMLVAMVLFVVWVSILFLARWWQTRLYDMPQSFADSFQQMNLGHALAAVMALTLVLVLFMPSQSFVQDTLGVLSMAFLLQGLAVIHFWQSVKKIHQGWIVLLYVLLGVIPHMMMMVASLGWLENWTNWRKKIASDSSS